MIPIRFVFFALGAGMGMLIPFQAVVLSGKGFDDGSIGLILALASAAGVIAAPLWGHLGDTVLGRSKVLMLAAAGSTLALAAFGWSVLPLVTAVAWVAFAGLSNTLVPTSDAVAVNAVRLAGRGDFGRLRLLLSFGFGSAAIASGFLFDVTGYGPAPWLAAGTFLALLLASRFVPEAGRAAPTAPVIHRRFGAMGEAFSVQPRLPIVLLTLGLGIGGLFAVFTYLPLRIEELGGSPSDVALASGLESFAEIPGFIAAGWLARHIGLRWLFFGSALLMAVCGWTLALLTDPSLMIGVRLLTGVAYSGITVATVLALAVLLPVSLQATAQNLNAMTGGVAGIATGLLGGLLLEVAGTSALFIVTSTGTAIAGLLALRVLPRMGPGAGPPAASPPGPAPVSPPSASSG
jgi:MFS family permease